MAIAPPVASRNRRSANSESNARLGEGRLSFEADAVGTSPLITEIRWRHGVIELISETWFGNQAGQSRESRTRLAALLERLFCRDEIRSVEVDRDNAALTIRLSRGSGDCVETMQRIIDTMTAETVAPHRSPVMIWDESPEGSFEIFRHGRMLTTWCVAARTATTLSLHHPKLIGSPDLVELTEDWLSHVPEISDYGTDQRSGVLTIRSAPGRILDEESLFRSLERIVCLGRTHLPAPAYPKAKLPWPIAALGLAVCAQWVNPAVWPAAAAIIVWLNLPMLRVGFSDLRRGVMGLPFLTVLIVSGTLAGGAFFAASLMTISARYWQNQYASMLSMAQDDWLRQLMMPHGSVSRRLPNDRFETVRIEKLALGDIVELTSPETVPTDGEWIDGEAEVVHPFGETIVGRVSEGDVTFPLFAGGWLRSGRLRMRVTAIGAETRAERVRTEILEASGVLRGSTSLNRHGQAFAERTVVPTLALAGFGFATAGLSEAVAVLRPDYTTGIGMGEGLERLRLGAEALREGFLVRDPEALRKIIEIELWLWESDHKIADAHAPFGPNVMVAEIRSDYRIDLLQGGHRLTLQGFQELSGDIERERLVAELRRAGIRKIGWIGDAEAYQRTAAAVDLAISTGTDFEVAVPKAAVVNLSGDREPDWRRLFSMAESSHEETRGLRMRAIVPNLLAVSGALMMGFDSLASVVLSNLGIFAVHRRVRKTTHAHRGIRHEPR